MHSPSPALAQSLNRLMYPQILTRCYTKAIVEGLNSEPLSSDEDDTKLVHLVHLISTLQGRSFEASEFAFTMPATARYHHGSQDIGQLGPVLGPLLR
ncbi:hypothetical protein TNCV_4073381 [Trichonephila clavipes]|uniref:Uncharacterized protein n=1 Tax=Trichonephila clavipes TaxID=2585209 RepID=A0A8X6W8C7_TRICX|nr:hypothetical protein TNCV_4073381 [Trichonephila clavipes]